MLEFSDILAKSGYNLSHVRLLRHQTRGYLGRTPYSLWRDSRSAFDLYQSVQTSGNRSKLAAPYWASFVAPANGGTLFVGLYDAERIGVVDQELIDPLYNRPAVEITNQPLDLYRLCLRDDLLDLVGRLSIQWGDGTRSWIQRGDGRGKPVVELTQEFREDVFPGYARFIANLSNLESLPMGWLAALKASRGIYLLTCPRTREQYVGSAYGEDGFLGRWIAYAKSGHGGNVALKSRDPSDYQVSILEVSGSSASIEDIIGSEQLWKAKLQSREMGLNRN